MNESQYAVLTNDKLRRKGLAITRKVTKTGQVTLRKNEFANWDKIPTAFNVAIEVGEDVKGFKLISADAEYLDGDAFVVNVRRSGVMPRIGIGAILRVMDVNYMRKDIDTYIKVSSTTEGDKPTLYITVNQ